MNLTEEVSSDEALLLSCDDVNKSWIVDSGPSFHATANVGFLTNIVKGDFDTVFLVDKSARNITGKGNARLLLPSGGTLVLHNVRLVPKLGRNLISVGKLADDVGYECTFGATFWKVTKGAMLVARGLRQGTLCNFLNYRRNMLCYHCEHKRPPGEFTDDKTQARPHGGPRKGLERVADIPKVSNAWNFDFDDNESDGADIAAFEFVDAPRVAEGSSLESHAQWGRIWEDNSLETSRVPKTSERRSVSGFNDFDDEEDDDVDSYELDTATKKSIHEIFSKSFSDIEEDSGSEGFDGFNHNLHSRPSTDFISHNKPFRKWEEIQICPRVMNKMFIQTKNTQSNLTGNLSSNRGHFRRETSDSDKVPGYGSESEDDDFHKNTIRGNKGGPDVRGSPFKDSSKFGSDRNERFTQNGVSSAARAKLEFKLVRVSWYQSDLVESNPVAMAEGPNATDSAQVTTLEERLDNFSDDQAHMGERLVTLEGVVEENMTTLLDQVAELSSKSQSSSQSQQRTRSFNNNNKGKNGGYQARSGGDQGHGQGRSGGASTGGASSSNSRREYHRPRNNGGASSLLVQVSRTSWELEVFSLWREPQSLSVSSEDGPECSNGIPRRSSQ
ncbi:hypothetical protein GIB67_006819 [Kingdonia uniflora]|uniref:Retrovirus-related Pol polyprotein from transposon TNT 1-94-like beta-barrel domain-containing protein n=1 Tax=Kingdonia uniflora TaxID=39325 RepID=A0A7J7L009_9MAGN|nr:hypothetical protein GIB67_006819 [Kingdonia uniflora]